MDQFAKERALQQRVEQTLGAAIPEADVYEVQLDQAQGTVRVFVDMPGGIDVEGCGKVTKAIRDTCPEYALEVSSPGVERPLRHRRHFADAVGHELELRVRGQAKKRTVTLESVGDDAIVVATAEGTTAVPFEDVLRARLVIDFSTYQAAAQLKERT